MSDFNEADRLINNLKLISEKYQEALSLIMKYKFKASLPILNSEKLNEIAFSAFNKILTQPKYFFDINTEYSAKFVALVKNTVARFTGEHTEPVYSPDVKDKRFKDPAWKENLYFDFIKQFYLISSEWMQKYSQNLGLEEHAQKYVEFYTKQFIDALCPSNFPFYNPEVVKASLTSKWENIVQGMDNFLEDLKNAGGILSIKTTDDMMFKLGENIAATEGKVIMQNDLMQLIYYKPAKETYSYPLLIVPPWINKYYVLDLSKENSFVGWLVKQGFSVFLISWVNPGSDLSDKNFEDYLSEGILEASKYICENLRFGKVNALGYCIGGTLLAIAGTYMKEKKMNYLNSLTYLTTLLDFKEPGEVGMFINNDTISLIENEMAVKGYFDGRYLAGSFSLLRANDLIWSFFVNNYLLGKRPLPFDLLYWNSDSANLPAKMHSFYLRNMYLENKLANKEIDMLQVNIDLSKNDMTSFFLAAKDDHIAPWRSVYASMNLFGGNKVFCLATSGHVAGVVNPPNQMKYSYWSNSSNCTSPDEWLSGSQETMGSWWNYWLGWQKKFSGSLKEENCYGNLKQLENAPGSYVMRKI